MRKSIINFSGFACLLFILFCGFRKERRDYDPSLATVETYGDMGIVKISRKGGRMKVKYFADQDQLMNSVNSRYNSWSQGKNVVAYTDGTYMTNCEYRLANPVGVCVDNGRIINKNIRMTDLDGLVIVQATGGVVASDLKEGNLQIFPTTDAPFTVDIRNNVLQFNQFLRWSVSDVATVFQAHLLIYKNEFKIGSNADTRQANNRRFLAVCREGDNISYFIINNRSSSGITLYNATVDAWNYLNSRVSQVVFMINLDTGCQNVFSVFSPTGAHYSNPLFSPDNPIAMTNAENLLVFYYE